jgi:exoribonuclease R
MYGILYFTSKSRVQEFGLPFIEYSTNQSFTVRSKKTYFKDMWAKVHPETHELMELIGPTGEYKAEVEALRGVYGLHYKYPSSPPPVLEYKPSSYAPIKAYTIDQASTLDRDDALSVTRDGDEITFGIHITDLARRLSPEWLTWARSRGSSAYWEDGTKPIFPATLAHETLSLTKGHTYPCLSLQYTYKNSELFRTTFGPCDVEIVDNLTYDSFATHPDRESFESLTDRKEPTEIVEWCMIQYNLHLAVNLPDVLLRVQDEDEPARYDYFGTHETMGGKPYTHATSPIRRFADFYNQCMYHNIGAVLTASEIDELNKRMNEIRSFHQRETVMSLAYAFKEKPCIMEAFIETNDNGRNICLRIKNKRVWIPLTDSYYEEPICQELKEGEYHQIECFGIHKNGKASLRLRLV